MTRAVWVRAQAGSIPAAPTGRMRAGLHRLNEVLRISRRPLHGERCHLVKARGCGPRKAGPIPVAHPASDFSSSGWTPARGSYPCCTVFDSRRGGEDAS